MVELPQQQPLMKLKPSNLEKVMAIEPRVAQVRHVADVDSHICQENAQHGASIVTSVEIKTTSVHIVGRGTENILKTETITDQPIGAVKAPPQSHKARGEAGPGIADMHQRTQKIDQVDPPPKVPTFQDHPELYESHSFQDHQETNDYVKKTFHTIHRSKSVACISNEMDPECKTKILTILNIKLPHQNCIDNLRVKVDDGEEANILPLDSFRTMFPHALNEQGYPKDGFLRGSRTKLECYNDGRLVNHGSIKLRLQQYSEKSFQDHYFYVVETKMTQ